MSHKLSATCLGQDRYRRRYWILPRFGGLLVEGLESGEPESIDPTAPETDDVVEMKDTVKLEENQEQSEIKQIESDDRTSKNEEDNSNSKDVSSDIAPTADNDTKTDPADVGNAEGVKLECKTDDDVAAAGNELKPSENASADEALSTVLTDSTNGNKVKSEENADLLQHAVKVEDCDGSVVVKHEMDVDPPLIKEISIEKPEHNGEIDSSKPSSAADNETCVDNKDAVNSDDKPECLSAADNDADKSSSSVSSSALETNSSQTVNCNNASGDSSKWLPPSVPGEHSSSALLLSLVMQNVNNGASKDTQSNDVEPAKDAATCSSPNNTKMDVTPAAETVKDDVLEDGSIAQSSPSTTVTPVCSSSAASAAAGVMSSMTPVKQAVVSLCETPQSESQAGTPTPATPSSAADLNSVGHMQLPEPGTHPEFDALICRISDTTLLATPVQDLIALAVTDGELPPDCLSEPKTLRSVPRGM